MGTPSPFGGPVAENFLPIDKCFTVKVKDLEAPRSEIPIINLHQADFNQQLPTFLADETTSMRIIQSSFTFPVINVATEAAFMTELYVRILLIPEMKALTINSWESRALIYFRATVKHDDAFYAVPVDKQEHQAFFIRNSDQSNVALYMLSVSTAEDGQSIEVQLLKKQFIDRGCFLLRPFVLLVVPGLGVQ